MENVLKNLIPFIPIFMIFAHIVDDYYLQGVLAKLKQKSYWLNPNSYPTEISSNPAHMKKYADDWIPALLMHSLSWSFMILLPFIICVGGSGVLATHPTAVITQKVVTVDTLQIFVVVAFLVNAVIHFVIDHLKANCYAITLVTDQMAHLFQIVVTFIIALVLGLYSWDPAIW